MPIGDYVPWYKKKPVDIQAMKLTKESRSKVEEWLMQYDVSFKSLNEGIWIATLEGWIEVSMGDYIIKGVVNEFYPCKPDVFEQTYEKKLIP